jgi:lipoprotein-anchoring transpeptidase ErfK/SrfK
MIKRSRRALAVLLPVLLPGTAIAAQATAPARAEADAKTMQVQVILDRLGFSPGVIDGRPGFNLSSAVAGFQKAHGLSPSGTIDPKTAAELAKVAGPEPVTEITLSPADLAGPYSGPLPKSEVEQAKLPSLGYATPLEMLAERFHTTPATLIALNSPATKLMPGVKIKVPNVITPARDYPPGLPDQYKETLRGLNVGSGQPQAARLVVSKSKRNLSVYDAADKLIAQFPVTTGSRYDPLPIGNWKVVGASYNPEFNYNPKLFWDAKKGDKKATLPPGPNGPVGIVWLDLSKPHYGIHGTPEPQNIGRTESHGCIRLSNWDAGRLSLMVKPGTPAVFQQ